MHDVRQDELESHGLLPCVKAVETRGDVLIVRLEGNVGKSVGSGNSTDENPLSLIPAAWEGPVIIDFARTREIDFTTVAFLVQALRKRAPAHSRLGIINAPAKLRAELEIAKLEEMLPTFASEREARRALTS